MTVIHLLRDKSVHDPRRDPRIHRSKYRKELEELKKIHGSLPKREGIDVIRIEIDYSKIRDCKDVEFHESIDISKRAMIQYCVFCDT